MKSSIQIYIMIASSLAMQASAIQRAVSPEIQAIEYLPKIDEGKVPALANITIKNSIRPALTMKSALNFIQTQGNAAAQRISRFVTSPQAMRALPQAIAGTLMDYILLRLVQQQLSPEEPFILGTGEFLLPFFAPAGILLFYETAGSIFEEAIKSGNTERARYLLDSNLVNPHVINHFMFKEKEDAPYDIPLIYAVQHNKPDIVELLLERGGANINEKDAQGKTVEDYLKILPTDSATKRQQKQKIFKIIRNHYESTETVAADALESLHETMYGTAHIAQAHNINTIVKSYITPPFFYSKQN